MPALQELIRILNYRFVYSTAVVPDFNPHLLILHSFGNTYGAAIRIMNDTVIDDVKEGSAEQTFITGNNRIFCTEIHINRIWLTEIVADVTDRFAEQRAYRYRMLFGRLHVIFQRRN